MLKHRHNPWFFNGISARGIGSPHTGINFIWPMSLIMQAMTSDNDLEIKILLEYIKRNTAGTSNKL